MLFSRLCHVLWLLVVVPRCTTSVVSEQEPKCNSDKDPTCLISDLEGLARNNRLPSIELAWETDVDQNPLYDPDEGVVMDCSTAEEKQTQYYYYGDGRDGIGQQLLSRLCLKVYCYSPQNKCQYLHVPFKGFHHNYRQDPNYTAMTEGFFNLASDTYRFAQVGGKCKTKKHYVGLDVRACPSCFFTEPVRKVLRHAYDVGTPAALNLLEPNAFNCVLYLRRGDMGAPDANGRGRLTNKEAIHILRKVKRVYNNCTVSVFTQGEFKDGTPRIWLDADESLLHQPLNETFADMMKQDPKMLWHFNEDVWSVYDAMVKADVLIMDHSTFPLTAAYYNMNTVISNAIIPGRAKIDDLSRWALPHWKHV